jgi:hypothetical protein
MGLPTSAAFLLIDEIAARRRREAGAFARTAVGVDASDPRASTGMREFFR